MNQIPLGNGNLRPFHPAWDRRNHELKFWDKIVAARKSSSPEAMLVPRPTVKIVDISHWNTITTLQPLVDEGYVGVIMKATESTWFYDGLFEKLWKQALDLKLGLGVYHFFRSHVDGNAQGKWFVDHVKFLWDRTGGVGLMPPWIDVETVDNVSMAVRRNNLLLCAQYVSKNLTLPGFYSSPYMWNSLIGDVPWIGQYWQWIAQWSGIDWPSLLPIGWSFDRCRVWQNGVAPKHSWVPPVPAGWGGEVDQNLYLGTADSYYQWIHSSAQPSLEERVKDLERRVTALEQAPPPDATV